MKKKDKVLVLGYFGYVTNQLDGQTIKTRNIYKLLESKKNEYFKSVDFFDTQSFKQKKINVFKLLIALFKCNILIYIPAHSNLKYLFPLFFFLTKIRGVKLHYVVVGGWLAEYLKKLPIHRILLKGVAGIYPQSDHLNNQLVKEYGFDNIVTLNNYRIQNFQATKNKVSNPIKLVFAARIDQMKGLGTIFKLGKEITKLFNGNVIIDLYGPVLNTYKEEFLRLESESPIVKYRGVVQPEAIYDLLNRYDLMLFPTKYFTEGFPGSILDAYISGIPVVASKWKHGSEFIDENKTGILCDFDNDDVFINKVMDLIRNPELIYDMKSHALSKSKDYSQEKAWEILKPRLVKRDSSKLI